MAAYRQAHRDEINAKRKSAYQNDKFKAEKRRAYKYGLTLSEVLALQAQRHCAICAVELTEAGRQKRCFDHCHTTGEVRGVICALCNSTIGYALDNPVTLRKAAEYLEGRTPMSTKA